MKNNTNLIKILKKNGVIVMPTDTLYGIVGQALSSSVVERIYTLRKRNPEKPCIILIGDIRELEKFHIKLSEKQKNVIKKYWFTQNEAKESLDSVSIILDCPNDSLRYLHRGTKTLAFRIPSLQILRNLLMQTGPLIAPSANTEALPPAKNITEAKKYFGNMVDLYIDGGEISGKASKVIQLHEDGSISVFRS